MKERVFIRRNRQSGLLAINREAIGKNRGVVFSIVSASLPEEPPPGVSARFSKKRLCRTS